MTKLVSLISHDIPSSYQYCDIAFIKTVHNVCTHNLVGKTNTNWHGSYTNK